MFPGETFRHSIIMPGSLLQSLLMQKVMWKNVHIITSLNTRWYSIVFSQSCFECSGSLSSKCVIGSFHTSLAKQTGIDLFPNSGRKWAECWVVPIVLCVCVRVCVRASITDIWIDKCFFFLTFKNAHRLSEAGWDVQKDFTSAAAQQSALTALEAMLTVSWYNTAP